MAILIENLEPDLLVSENVEKLLRKSFPKATFKTTHAINALEIEKEPITSYLAIDQDNGTIELETEVKHQLINLWILVIVGCSYRIFVLAGLIIPSQTAYYFWLFIAFALSLIPGLLKRREYEYGRAKMEKEMTDIIIKSSQPIED